MENLRSYGIHRGIILALGLLCIAAASGQAAGDSQEVWISARTNALGSGIIRGSGDSANPFYGDFDAILNSLPPATTIHLLPGVHYTKGFEFAPGDAVLKANQKVIGAGIDATIVRRDPRFHPDTADNEAELWSSADGVEVSDLTVDASGTGADTNKNNGVALRGNDCAVRRVKVINPSGCLARGQESFPICAGNTGTVGNVISECEVSSVQGDYCTAIALLGQGVVSRCRVSFLILTNVGQGAFQAYQASGTRNAVFRGNTCNGGSSGFYTDTFSETNLTLAGNSFFKVVNGIVFTKSRRWLVDGLAIRNNLIELSTNWLWFGKHGIVIRNDDKTGTVVYRNITVSGNTIRFAAPPAARSRAIAVQVSSAVGTNCVNVRILNNSTARPFAFVLNATGVRLAGNTDLDGVPLDIRHIKPGSPASVSLSPIDGLVFVGAPGTTNLILPAARGFDGKRVTIINRKPAGAVTVRPPPGERLSPTPAVIIPAGRTRHFLSDGLGGWTAE